MTLSNRKIAAEILPGTFAKVIYEGPEGVIAAAPGTATVAALGGASHYVYERAIEGEDPKARIDENSPAAVYLPYTNDPEYSKVELGHKYCCDNGKGIEDLVAAACRSSAEAALFLVKHGGLITECYPKEAYDDPAFCEASVALYIPRIAHVPEKNLTPELYLMAIRDNDELYHDFNDGHIPLAPLARADFAKAVFAAKLPDDVIETLSEIFDKNASLFLEAAQDKAWVDAVPAELHGWSTAVKAAVNKLG